MWTEALPPLGSDLMLRKLFVEQEFQIPAGAFPEVGHAVQIGKKAGFMLLAELYQLPQRAAPRLPTLFRHVPLAVEKCGQLDGQPRMSESGVNKGHPFGVLRSFRTCAQAHVPQLLLPEIMDQGVIAVQCPSDVVTFLLFFPSDELPHLVPPASRANVRVADACRIPFHIRDEHCVNPAGEPPKRGR